MTRLTSVWAGASDPAMRDFTCPSVWRPLVAALMLLCSVSAWAQSEETYLSVPEFLAGHFESVPAPSTLWLDESSRESARTISGEDPGFRQRYWRVGRQVAWVLNVIGRDHPITVGILVDESGVQDMRVLVYRESRGWEVRHDFFTRQFDGARLDGRELDRDIDNITGATLSVRAMKRAARLALWAYGRVMDS